MSILGNSLLLGAEAAGPTAYQVSRSLRFNAGDSAFLSKSFGSAGNSRTFTFSAWVKRNSSSSTLDNIFGAGTSTSSPSTRLYFYQDKLAYQSYTGSANDSYIETSQVFRDYSAWYHITLSVDTTNGTADNRQRLYVNGTEVTAFSSRTNHSLNADTYLNRTTYVHEIGRTTLIGSSSYIYANFQLADIWFLDGIAATPSDFAETNATTGQWVPKTYSGSKGSNGFHLEFADNSAATAAALGKDTSGNSNNWTPNNFSVLDGRTSVAAATGALPIYNTTDTYGAALGSGVRSDSFASSLVLAAPLTTQGGGSLTNDVSPSGRTSSTKTLTNTNVTSSTSVSKYYGGSAVFSSSSSSAIDIAASSDFQFGSGDFTVEFWIYPTNTTGQNVLGYGNSSGGTGFALIKTASQFQGQFAMSDGTKVFTGGSYTVNTWNHVAAVRSGSTITLYVNGTSSATASTSGSVTTGTDGFAIGRYGLYGGSCDAQFQDVRVYKGVAKYTSNFTPPTSVQNVTTAAGCDSTVDTPTSYGTDTGAGGEVRGNYATLNPLAYGGDIQAPTNGNLDVTSGTSSDGSILGTFGMSSGKWYFEVTCNNTSTSGIGIAKSGVALADYPGQQSEAWVVQTQTPFYKVNNNTPTALTGTFNSGDVIGVAFDADNGNLSFYQNGSVIGSNAFTGLTNGPYLPIVGDSNSTPSISLSCNFGQRAFAYTAPSGFKALCDTNLTAPVIAKSSDYFQTTLWTGNGASTRSITGLNFSPDFVWIKSRSRSDVNHNLFDVIRGTGKTLYSNTTDSEATNNGYGYVSSFDSTGFGISAGGAGSLNVNNSSDTYVAWAWDAGTSTVTNTQGSITSSVRANASAGFSIVTYTGNGSAATVGHGLNALPSFFVIKNRSGSPAANNWYVGHTSITWTKVLILNTTDAASTGSDWTPTSTLLTIPSGLSSNGINYVAYCFAPVAGYSSFGSYTGNGSADGVFVHLGFRPKWLMVKRTDAAEYWIVFDAVRNTYNIVDLRLLPSASNAEGSLSTNPVDFLSNGFKNRGSDTFLNGSGATYIYAAFAESPFQYARAR